MHRARSECLTRGGEAPCRPANIYLDAARLLVSAARCLCSSAGRLRAARGRPRRADAVFFQVRTGEQPQLREVEAALTALDRAVAADPVAGRRLGGPRCCWRRRSREARGARAAELQMAGAGAVRSRFRLGQCAGARCGVGPACRRTPGDRRTVDQGDCGADDVDRYSADDGGALAEPSAAHS